MMPVPFNTLADATRAFLAQELRYTLTVCGYLERGVPAAEVDKLIALEIECAKYPWPDPYDPACADLSEAQYEALLDCSAPPEDLFNALVAQVRAMDRLAGGRPPHGAEVMAGRTLQ